MNAGNDFSGVLSLLVWATLLPLVIVLVMRSRHRHDDHPDEGASAPPEEPAPDRTGIATAEGARPAEAPKQDAKSPLS
jgi:hypothetical protein